MIEDRVVSARAENRQMARCLGALAVAATVSLFPLAGHAAESSSSPAKAADSLERLTLPPIQYLDTMPWANWERPNATIKVDTLLSPVLDPTGIRLDDAAPRHRDSPQAAMS